MEVNPAKKPFIISIDPEFMPEIRQVFGVDPNDESIAGFRPEPFRTVQDGVIIQQNITVPLIRDSLELQKIREIQNQE